MAARRYGRRLRRGAAGTAVAAVAMAALSASQAPGLFGVAHAAAQTSGQNQQSQAGPPPGPQIDGGSPYVTDLPPLNTSTGPLAPAPGGGPVVTVPAGASLPTTVLAAYQRAEAALRLSQPGCHLPWQLLAGIGQVESGQARGGRVDANGTTLSPILGPELNGNGFANIPDTDGGRWDGDPVHDRAVGPMQFIPSTWATWGADGNGDGVKDPNNVFDAALAAGDYLCANNRNLAVPSQMDRAILGYNHSQAYLNLVKAWYRHFLQGGAVSVPDSTGNSGQGVAPVPNPSTTPITSPSSPSSPATPGAPPSHGAVSPGDSIHPTPPGTLPHPSTSPTGSPSTPPTSAPPTTPPTSVPPTTPPTTGPTTPGDPTTTPGCPTDSPSPSPSDSASPSPTDSSTPDPCVTDSATPSPADTAGSATGSALTPSPATTAG